MHWTNDPDTRFKPISGSGQNFVGAAAATGRRLKDTQSGELRLIEVKGIGGPTGTIPLLQEPVKEPARFDWLGIDALTHPMRLREGENEP